MGIRCECMFRSYRIESCFELSDLVALSASNQYSSRGKMFQGVSWGALPAGGDRKHGLGPVAGCAPFPDPACTPPRRSLSLVPYRPRNSRGTLMVVDGRPA